MNTTPAAIDSPAEPMVWTMLFSRMVDLSSFLPSEMAMTATGIDAETVRPALRARYTVAAPNRMPIKAPIRIAFTVNSAIASPGAM